MAVIGAAGRMGAVTCQAVEAAEDLRLVARIERGQSMAGARQAGAEVAVDFTEPGAVIGNITTALSTGLHVVVGTSGFDADRLQQVRRLLAEHPGRGVVVAPNFAIGAVLLMRFARQAAASFDSAEVIELHHAAKLDAPSGTAVRTAEEIAVARQHAGLCAVPDATASERAGARGTSIDGVHVHSVRLPGLVAHQEVLLGNPGEVLTLRHDAVDRAAFLPGVLLAIRSVVARPGLTVGLEPLLGLD